MNIKHRFLKWLANQLKEYLLPFILPRPIIIHHETVKPIRLSLIRFVPINYYPVNVKEIMKADLIRQIHDDCYSFYQSNCQDGTVEIILELEIIEPKKNL